MPEFKSSLRDKREAIGITRQVLSIRSGIPNAHIYMIETGRRKPHIKTAYKISKALGIPIEELFPMEEMFSE